MEESGEFVVVVLLVLTVDARVLYWFSLVPLLIEEDLRRRISNEEERGAVG